MNWTKQETPDNKFFKSCCWTIGDIKKDTLYSVLEVDDGYILRTRHEKSRFEVSDNWVGKFKELSKAQLVAQMIDEG